MKYFLFDGIGKQPIKLNSSTMKDAVKEAREIRKNKGVPSDMRTCRALISREK